MYSVKRGPCETSNITKSIFLIKSFKTTMSASYNDCGSINFKNSYYIVCNEVTTNKRITLRIDENDYLNLAEGDIISIVYDEVKLNVLRFKIQS